MDEAKKYIILIIYDISDNKHRLKFVKLLERYGTRVQKSCFEASLPNRLYFNLLAEIKTFINDDDNIRVYKLGIYDEVQTFGTRDYELDPDVIIV